MGQGLENECGRGGAIGGIERGASQPFNLPNIQRKGRTYIITKDVVEKKKSLLESYRESPPKPAVLTAQIAPVAAKPDDTDATDIVTDDQRRESA